MNHRGKGCFQGLKTFSSRFLFFEVRKKLSFSLSFTWKDLGP